MTVPDRTWKASPTSSTGSKGARTRSRSTTTTEETIDAFEDYFGRRNTAVAVETTPSGAPTNFAVLRDGDRFLAAGPVEPAYRAIEFDPAAFSGTDLGVERYPAILEHAATTAVTSYDKRRMILASREIETDAWRVGAGELHADFQRLSLLDHQRDVYAKLAGRNIDVHVYGVPDWTPPEDLESMTFHEETDEEIRNSWFVVFDGNGEDRHKAALVSEEWRPGEFYGFWTYEPALVDEILAYFRGGRVPVPPTATGTTTSAD